MDNLKWTIAGLLIVFAVLGGGVVNEGGETSVWVGVKVDDEDYHACAFYTHAKHMPKDMLCEAPETPVRGGYEITTVSDDDDNNTQHVIQYHCDSGYDLVGHANRTCNETSEQWTTQEPYCQPKYITEPKQWLKTIDDRMTASASTMKDMDNRITTIMDILIALDNKLTALETKQANFENETETMNTTDSTSTVSLTCEYDCFKEHLSRNGQLATVSFKNGSLVSEFTWMVKNIEEEITKAKGNEYYEIQSKQFYTNVPGYRLQLQLRPNYGNSNYIGIFVEFFEGAFDDIVSWPFSSRYEFVSVGRNGNRIAYDSTYPTNLPACTIVFLRPPANSGACGERKYIKSDSLLSNKDENLIDGSLKIKTIFTLSN